MPSRKRPYGLFEAFHLATDYHVVDGRSLDVLPIVPEIFSSRTGTNAGEVMRGSMVWDHQVASHMVQVRTLRPALKPVVLHKRQATELRALNELLATRGAMLLPGGAHPWMIPAQEVQLWPLDGADTAKACDRIFGCRTHGWSNAAGSHLQLHFHGEREFTALHAAVRLLLPIIPALSASSPFLDGRSTGFLDARMEAYLHAQEKHPEMMGSLIPEAVFDQEAYYREIYGPIAKVLAGYGTAGVYDHEHANGRGAVPHFDLGLLEINVIDTQEFAGADLAIAEFIMAVLKALVSGRWASTYLQRAWSEHDLLAVFLQVIKDAGNAVIANSDYLLMFGLMKQERMAASKLWQHLFVELYGDLSEPCRQHIAHLLEHGCLASRILRHTGKKPGHEKLRSVFSELSKCLREDRPFK